MNLSFLKLGPAGGGLRWLQWVAVLIAVGLFAAFSLLITLVYPAAEQRGEKALMWINGIAAVLAMLIAPYLLRSFEQMLRRTESQNNELRTLHAIDKAINAHLDLRAILQVAVTEATRAVDAEVGAFALWREDRPGQSEDRAVYGISEAMQATLGEALDERIRTLAQSGGTERRTDLDGTWQTDRLNSSLRLRNLIAVPVQYQGKRLGLLLLGNRAGALAPGAGFTPEDEALLAAVAGTVAVAVQNARFVLATRRRGEMLRALVAHTGEAIAASSDAPGLMRLFAGAAARLLGCPRVAVYAHDEAEDLFVPLAAIDQRTGQGEESLTRFARQPLPARSVLRGLGGRPDGDCPDGEARAFPQTQAALGLESGSGDFLSGPGVVFALHARDRRCLGLLWLGELPPGQEVAEFAQALAAQAAVTLENAHLFAALEVQFRREKRIAGELQKNLLPDIPARVGGFEFASEYQAALAEAQIGGDFLDLFPLGGDRVGIVMADVSGKGLKAAVQTAAVKYTLRAFAHEQPQAPGRVLAQVNDVLCSGMNPLEGFITLFYGVLDVRGGEMVYACAGHEPPLLRRADTGHVSLLEGADGMALGCFPGFPYGDRAVTLAPGDSLLLYTDGVTEARAADGTFFGADGLLAALPAAGLSAPAALAQLRARLHAFSGDTQRDDIAMLLLLRAPERPAPPILRLAAAAGDRPGGGQESGAPFLNTARADVLL